MTAPARTGGRVMTVVGVALLVGVVLLPFGLFGAGAWLLWEREAVAFILIGLSLPFFVVPVRWAVTLVRRRRTADGRPSPP